MNYVTTWMDMEDVSVDGLRSLGSRRISTAPLAREIIHVTSNRQHTAAHGSSRRAAGPTRLAAENTENTQWPGTTRAPVDPLGLGPQKHQHLTGSQPEPSWRVASAT